MNLPIFLALIIVSCSGNLQQDSSKELQEIIVKEIEKMPEEIEGCACYLAQNDSLFEKKQYIFASNSDSTAFMQINDELIRFSMTSTTNEPFTFKSEDLIEKYSSEKYDLKVVSHFEDSTSYESWIFHGEINVSDIKGNKENVNFVGVCGC